MTTSPKKEFFVSYRSVDKAWAEWIAWTLEAAGRTVLLQAWDFVAGEDFVDLMNEGVKCDRMILVLTPNYLSQWTEREWKSRIALDPSGKSVLLVRVQECRWDLIPLLSSSVQVDFVGLPKEQARKRLLEAVIGAPRTPKKEPPFPPETLQFRNLPRPRENAFTGRQGLLDEIRRLLDHNRQVALVGMAGVGKTDLAVEYAYRFFESYSLIWWFQAETAIEIRQGFDLLAEAAGLKRGSTAMEAVKSWLKRHDPWLLIFDNAQDPSAIRSYIPSEGTGHILITSRYGVWAPVARTHLIPVLERSESAELLRRLSENTDDIGIEQVAETLGDLPLALKHAGTYVGAAKCSWKEYIEVFSRVYRSPSEHEDSKANQDRSSRQEEIVAATWDISIEEAGRESDWTNFLMNLTAFCASNSIPQDIFHEQNVARHSRSLTLGRLLPAGALDSARLNEVIARLIRYSLIRADLQSISVHRLVQRAIHRRLPSNDRRAWAQLACSLLIGCISRAGRDSGIAIAVLPHLLSAACLAEVLDAENRPENAWTILRQQLDTRFLPGEIERHLDAAIEVVEWLYGPDNENLTGVLNRLGGMMDKLGRTNASARYFERAQAIGSSPEFRLSYDDAWKPQRPLDLRSVPGLKEPPRRLRVLMVASEAAPFAKTGGVADVLGALPVALCAQGAAVAVILPGYRSTKGVGGRIVCQGLPIAVGPHSYQADIRQLNERGVSWFFVEIPALFDREHLYDDSRGSYQDNDVRFGALCYAALEVARRLFHPHVIHCHDWQGGLVPAIIQNSYPRDPTLTDVKTVFTVHNLGYQGLFKGNRLKDLGLSDRLFDYRGMEFYGDTNILKAGLIYSDRITTVSPTYAREIQTPEFGFGLDGVMRERTRVLTGILNGVDYSEWDPATDRHLPAPYSVDDVSGKRVCKAVLLQEVGLMPDLLGVPVIGIVSRLAAQKGFDLLASVVPELIQMGLGIVVLGSGEVALEDLARNMVTANPGRFAARLGFDNSLAHKIEAGADMFLMPSRYEPCGLNQIYSLRYGTVPIVRAVGGLDDTIDSQVGFKFTSYTREALLSTVRDAIAAFGDRTNWEQRMRAGMLRDYSWNVTAQSYLTLYKELAPEHQ
jgi:starch synthase